MHYGEPVVRRTVPLALGILSASNPVLTIMDTLSRYSHDNDLQVAINAIFAMGLVGAGTNNARLAQMLRQLASYYSKEADCLFMVRIAQVRPVLLIISREGADTARSLRDSFTWARARSVSTPSTRTDLSCLPSLLLVSWPRSLPSRTLVLVSRIVRALARYPYPSLPSHSGQVSLDALLHRHGHVPRASYVLLAHDLG